MSWTTIRVTRVWDTIRPRIKYVRYYPDKIKKVSGWFENMDRAKYYKQLE